MHWIVQENVCKEAKWDDLIHTLERLEIPHTVVTVTPFTGEMTPIPDIKPKEKVWCMGSLSMIETCQKMGWEPGVIPLGIFDFELWETFLPKCMLNTEAKVVSFADIIYDRVPLFKSNFVRPTDDSKFIKGSVLSDTELREWADKIKDLTLEDQVNPETLLVVGPVRHDIVKEMRFWVVNTHIVTQSQYKVGDMILHDNNVSEEAWEYADYVAGQLSAWYDLPAYCMDVCELLDGSYKVVEFNNLNSSGFYDCNIPLLVDAIERHFC